MVPENTKKEKKSKHVFTSVFKVETLSLSQLSDLFNLPYLVCSEKNNII